MIIRFDPDFDGGAWPGPLADREATAGEAWLGPLGLLNALETALGLGGPVPTAGERAAGLVPGLRGVEGFWSRSAEVDPLGSARELLGWRDELVMAGWRGAGDGMPERVARLAKLCGEVLPGVPDRIWRVVERLGRHSGEVAVLELLEPLESLPLAWQKVIRALGEQGTSLRPVQLEPAPATGDLAAARAPELRPQGDGSLQLVRSDGPWAAAVEVAAWLAARESRESCEGVVVVSPTPLLDSELRRFGLPTTGTRQVGGGSPLLEVLPLVLALGWKPAAPDDAAALLSLTESPVPRGIRNRLRGALSEWPAVGSDAWVKALERGLEAIDATERRERVRNRLRGIFEGSVERTARGYPVTEVRARTSLVRDWLRRRRAMLDDAADADLVGALDLALEQCTAFERVVDLAELERWDEADIQRFLDEARSGLPPERVLEAQAGLASVAAPGAVAGPARCVVWWDFSRERAPSHVRLPFARTERAQLARAGIELRSAVERSLREAARWRRPLDQASEVLLLVSPRMNEAGEESHPHPLWDEIGARLHPDVGARRALFHSGALYATPRSPLEEKPLRPLPSAPREWKVAPKWLALQERLSHSAVDDLLRCSMRFALKRLTQLRGPDEVEVDISNRVLGRLAHALLEDVLPAAAGDPQAAERLAGEWFDTRAATRVAALFLPGRDAEAARVRRILVGAARLFAEFTRAASLELGASEQEIEGHGLGRTLFGIPDLVLGPKPLIVDAKWGGFTGRRDALKKGTATQLAFYAHLLGQQPGSRGVARSVAFFVLSRGRILTTDPELGFGSELDFAAELVEGPLHAETWLALERAFEARQGELRRGLLLATANPDANGGGVPEGDSLQDGDALVLAPKCGWCEYGGLCGADLAEGGS